MTLKTAVLAVCSLVVLAAGHAQTIKEYSAEARFQFDVLVPDAALAPYIPQGWSMNVATQGPAKDCNLRVIFIERQTINGPDGKPVGKGSNTLVYLAAPVKDPSGAAAQLIIGGLTADPADAPGPFGNYLLATEHSLKRSLSIPSTGPANATQEWVFRTATGEHFELSIQYEPGVANKGNPADVKFCSSKDPSMCQISHQEQVLDIMRNATTNPPNRVKSYTFKGGGGSYAKLFDGTEKHLSWDNIIWINRTVSVP